MALKFYIGDLVDTIYGTGRVVKSISWIEAIKDLEDWDVPDFCQKCQVDVGLNYKNDWNEIVVKLENGSFVEVQGKFVTILEGRDGFEESGLERIVGKKNRKAINREQAENTGSCREEKQKTQRRNKFTKK